MLPAVFFGFLIFIATLVAIVAWTRYRRLARERYLREYAFPKGLYARLQKRRPELSLRDCSLVARGLRQFFLAYLNGGRRFVAMPSQAVDDLWHEFILYTKHYDQFCRKAFGRFLHHTPAVALGPAQQNNAGLRRVWWQSCREENIDPAKPLRLPLLFAIDAKLGIADGFHYAPDCKALREAGVSGTVHCGGDFCDASVDGGTDGFGDSAADGGSDGGCGGGCGGD